MPKKVYMLAKPSLVGVDVIEKVSIKEKAAVVSSTNFTSRLRGQDLIDPYELSRARPQNQVLRRINSSLGSGNAMFETEFSGAAKISEMETLMSTINAQRFAEICDAVWTDRAAVLMGRGVLSGEATLLRAVFWRLCNVGVKSRGTEAADGTQSEMIAYQVMVGRMLKTNGRPSFDGEPILKQLIERYQAEVKSNTVS